MGLDLNNMVVPYEGNKYFGRVVDKMPELIADGRTPANTATVMKQRLESGLQDWKDNYFFLGDAIAYHPDGKFKIVRDSQTLRELIPANEDVLRRGALVLPDGAYETLQGTEFTRKSLNVDEDLTGDEAKSHPIWKEVARDQTLLDAYVDTMFPEMKKKFNYDKNMGIYLENGDEMPTLRALIVGRLVYRSQLYGGNYLDNGNGRLVGVAPEALNAHSKAIQKPSLATL